MNGSQIIWMELSLRLFGFLPSESTYTIWTALISDRDAFLDQDFGLGYEEDTFLEPDFSLDYENGRLPGSGFQLRALDYASFKLCKRVPSWNQISAWIIKGDAFLDLDFSLYYERE
ncbi:hypothetical protein GLOIN_2v1769695 [Rhizophagus clarus]|uniref:Uncharacterized protein n=1 Tax=Rhizophagus clarus TaxID=94130 RepID=A0A8H3R0H3_9GLOM|nr:hypothetical protein GLOIN_2v1769695 [Rhizophagus clarus]